MTQCPWCEQPLIEINFNKHRISMCDNWRCPLYRQHQRIRRKIAICRVCRVELIDGNWSPFRRKGHSEICRSCDSAQRILRPTYQSELARKREMYAFARSLNISARVAARIDYKSREYIEEFAQRENLNN